MNKFILSSYVEKCFFFLHLKTVYWPCDMTFSKLFGKFIQIHNVMCIIMWTWTAIRTVRSQVSNSFILFGIHFIFDSVDCPHFQTQNRSMTQHWRAIGVNRFFKCSLYRLRKKRRKKKHKKQLHMKQIRKTSLLHMCGSDLGEMKSDAEITVYNKLSLAINVLHILRTVILFVWTNISIHCEVYM